MLFFPHFSVFVWCNFVLAISDNVFMQLSLFAESFNEMLQFEMGCCLLSFLEVQV